MARKTSVGFLVMMVCLLLSSLAGADTFTVSGNDSNGDPISAQVVITVSSGQVTVVLTDLLVNPKDIGQLLSDLSFTVSGASAASIGSSSATERTVAANGTFTDGSTVTPGWAISFSAGTIKLDDLAGGAAGPAHLIIGAPGGSTYSAANASIAGNGPHNPFLANSATWILNVTGVTPGSTIGNVVFSFGTTPGDNHGSTPVPEPSSLLLLGSGLASLGAWGRRRWSRASTT